MSSGIEKAWELLASLDTEEVSKNAGVGHENDEYILRSLGLDFAVNPLKKEIRALSGEGDALMKRLGYFFDHSALWYLIGAKNLPPSGRLVKPQSLKGGHHFFMGTHELPLGALAAKYKGDKEGFIERGEKLGGRVLSYGDASVEIYPMPRVPVTLILWLPDDEFEERADLLFDSTVEIHLPLDISWSVAMLTVLSLM